MFLDLALARRLEEAERLSTIAHAEARARLVPTGGATCARVGDGTAVYTGRGLPVTGVFGLGMHAPVTTDHLDQAAAFFAEREEAAFLHLCPFADESLARALSGRIRRVTQFKQMWVRPAVLDDVTPAEIGENEALVIREAVTDAERWHWARMVSWGFWPHGRLEDANTDVGGPNAFTVGSRVFVAWLGDQSIGAGALWIGDGVARLYSTTLAEWRNRGAQTALIVARINAARSAGCDLVAVTTLPGTASQRNIERFGFRVAYTRVAVEF